MCQRCCGFGKVFDYPCMECRGEGFVALAELAANDPGLDLMDLADLAELAAAEEEDCKCR